jgi:hypothetical protein
MKKAYVVKGTVYTTFYGDYCDDNCALRSLTQQVSNVDDEAFVDIEIEELNEDNVPNGHYGEIMFCLNDDCDLSSTEFTAEEYLESQDRLDDIKVALEEKGWDMESEFQLDLLKTLEEQGYLT